MKALTKEEIIAGARPLPQSKGIYFLLKNNDVVYVGQTVNIFQRLGTHSLLKDFTHYFFMPFNGDKNEVDALERFYITKFQPPLNTHKTCWMEVAVEEDVGTPIERALRRIQRGQSAYSAAKSIGVSVNAIYRSSLYRELQGLHPKRTKSPG